MRGNVSQKRTNGILQFFSHKAFWKKQEGNQESGVRIPVNQMKLNLISDEQISLCGKGFSQKIVSLTGCSITTKRFGTRACQLLEDCLNFSRDGIVSVHDIRMTL